MIFEISAIIYKELLLVLCGKEIKPNCCYVNFPNSFTEYWNQRQISFFMCFQQHIKQ